MSWQDPAITIVIFALSYALIPQILLAYKKKKSLISIQTATITILCTISLGIIYLTLGLVFSSIMALVTSMLWATLLIQSKIYNK